MMGIAAGLSIIKLLQASYLTEDESQTLSNLLLDPAKLQTGETSKPRRFGEKKAQLMLASFDAEAMTADVGSKRVGRY